MRFWFASRRWLCVCFDSPPRVVIVIFNTLLFLKITIKAQAEACYVEHFSNEVDEAMLISYQLFPLGALGGPGTSSLFADREFTLWIQCVVAFIGWADIKKSYNSARKHFKKYCCTLLYLLRIFWLREQLISYHSSYPKLRCRIRMLKTFYK